MIQIIIADDNFIIRKSLKAILGKVADIELIAEADNGEEAIQLAVDLQPDIVLMDFNMPNFNGIEAMSWLRQQGITARILLLTAYKDEALVKQALEKGAAGYLVKHSSSDELVEAIYAVHQGQTYLGHGVHEGEDTPPVSD